MSEYAEKCYLRWHNSPKPEAIHFILVQKKERKKHPQQEKYILTTPIRLYTVQINQICVGWSSATYRAVWMFVSTLPVCLPASIVQPSVCVSVTLSSCLFTRCACASAFLHIMYISISEARSFARLPTQQRGDTRAGAGTPWPAASRSRCQFGLTTCSHSRDTVAPLGQRKVWRGRADDCTLCYGWGVADKRDHPTNVKHLHPMGQALRLVAAHHMIITGYKNSSVLLLCLWVQSVFTSFPLNFDPKTALFTHKVQGCFVWVVQQIHQICLEAKHKTNRWQGCHWTHCVTVCLLPLGWARSADLGVLVSPWTSLLKHPIPLITQSISVNTRLYASHQTLQKGSGP